VLAVELLGRGGDDLSSEIPARVADGLLFRGQVEVHVTNRCMVGPAPYRTLVISYSMAGSRGRTSMTLPVRANPWRL
jgi:hypothetical protein